MAVVQVKDVWCEQKGVPGSEYAIEILILF